jgi:hypothetical protein
MLVELLLLLRDLKATGEPKTEEEYRGENENDCKKDQVEAPP